MCITESSREPVFDPSIRGYLNSKLFGAEAIDIFRDVKLCTRVFTGEERATENQSTWAIAAPSNCLASTATLVV